MFVIGEDLESINFGNYLYSPKEEGFVNRDFSDVVADNIFCFDGLKREEQDIQGRILVQLVDAGTLSLEMQEGSCGNGPWSFDKFSEFER